MKRAIIIIVVCLVACTKQQALDVTKITTDLACAIGQAELADAEIAAVCKLTDDVLTDIRPALEAHRRTLVRRGLARANTCDAGAP